METLDVSIKLKKKTNVFWGSVIVFGATLLVGVMLWGSFARAVDDRHNKAVLYSRMLENGVTRTVESVEASLLSISEDIRPSGGGSIDIFRVRDRMEQTLRFAPHIRQIVLTQNKQALIDTRGPINGEIDFDRLALPQTGLSALSGGVKIGKQVSRRFLPYEGEKVGKNSKRSLIPLVLDIPIADSSSKYSLIVALNSAYIRNLFSELDVAEKDRLYLLGLDGADYLGGSMESFKERILKTIDQMVQEGKDEKVVTPVFTFSPPAHIAVRLSEKYPFAIAVLADHGSTLRLWFDSQSSLILGLIAAIIAIFVAAFALMRDYLKSAALQEQVHLLLTAVHGSPVSIVITDDQMQLKYANPAFAETFGFNLDDLKGKVLPILEKGLVKREIYLEIRNVLDQGMPWQGEFKGKTKEGKTLPLTAAISPIGGKAGKFTHLVGVLSDDTERKQAEDELRKLSRAVEQSPATVVITDADGNIEYVNPKFSKITGYAAKEVLGKNPRILNSGERPNEDYQELWKTISSGNEWRGEFHNRRKDGTLFWEAASISPIRSPEGKISNYLAVKEDITDRKELEEQVRRAQKMDAVGQLTGGIAHDFNNTLGIVMGNLELLQRMVSGNDKALRRVEKALNGAKRGADLTRRLLSFSRKETLQVSRLLVNDIITSHEDLIARSLTASILVETRLADNLWHVKINAGELEDAILNLSLNARDAMPSGGKLIIETANKTLDQEYVRTHPHGKAGEFVMVSVSDTGVGMSEEVIERASEPFFTTKEQGKGTGLGLSMVYGFVQRSGGHIHIFSKLGEGTTLCLFLPRATSSVEDVDSSIEAGTLPNGTETVLVVDDEEALRDIAVSYLEGLGYKTYSAVDAAQALAILKGRTDIDLLFSDVIMPGENDGFQLASIAHLDNPSIKILMTSGFTNKSEEHVDNDDEFLVRLTSDLLRKPYNQSELAIAVRRQLDRG